METKSFVSRINLILNEQMTWGIPQDIVIDSIVLLIQPIAKQLKEFEDKMRIINPEYESNIRLPRFSDRICQICEGNNMVLVDVRNDFHVFDISFLDNFNEWKKTQIQIAQNSLIKERNKIDKLINALNAI